MVDWVVRTAESFGYIGIFFLMALENIFPPIPSEIIMTVAGFSASRGDLTLVGAILAGTLGSMAGNLPYYVVGRWVGTDRVRQFADRFGKWAFISRRDIDRADAWFDRYNALAVGIGRCIPGIRTVISLPAGAFEMSLAKFLIYSVIGTLVWNTFLATVGYLLGENWRSALPYVQPIGTVVVLILVVVAVVWLVRRILSRRSIEPT